MYDITTARFAQMIIKYVHASEPPKRSQKSTNFGLGWAPRDPYWNESSNPHSGARPIPKLVDF